MNFKFARSVHFYYISVMTILMVCVLSGIIFYWKNGPANMENMSSIFEATIQLDDLKKSKQINKIQKLIGNDRIRDAVKRMESFESDILRLNKVKNIKEFNILEVSLKNSKKSLNNLLSYPELTSIMLVLVNKITAFESFVVSNQWRTLTRMSKRIKAKLSPGKVRGPGFFTFKKISNLNKSLVKDIELMKKITIGSVLSREDKNVILLKVKTLETEVKMLTSYIKELKIFKKDFINLKGDFSVWFEKVGPGITVKRMEVEKNSQNFLFSLIGLLSFIFLSTGFGFLVYRWNELNRSEKVERTFLDIIKDGMLPLDGQSQYDFSKITQAEFDKYRSYIHKRMSFGSVFQEAVPFSSVLLDSNLNVVWANSLFYDHWELEDYKKKDESVTWDFLQRFTNLGDHDPVLSALNENVAGIYQIQVKLRQTEDSLPYEMYVSPVDYAGQKRIMIFFYPLRSLEETLHNQNQSLVGPVARTLDALSTNQFSNNFKEKILNDYDIAGISHIFEKFEKLNERTNNQKNGLVGEIERLENDLYDEIKLVDDLSSVNSSKKDLESEAMKKFSDAKESIISIVDLRTEMESLFQNTVITAKDLFDDELFLLSQTDETNKVLSESAIAFETVSAAKQEFKVLKSDIEQFRSRILQVLDQVLIFQRNDENSQKLEQGLSKIKNEVKDFEKTLSAFGKVAKTMDVSISKMEIIMEAAEKIDLSELKGKFDDARDRIESDVFNVNRLTRNGQSKDEKMIKSLREMYVIFQESRSKLKDVEHLVSEHKSKGDLIDLSNGLRQDLQGDPKEVSQESLQDHLDVPTKQIHDEKAEARA